MLRICRIYTWSTYSKMYMYKDSAIVLDWVTYRLKTWSI